MQRCEIPSLQQWFGRSSDNNVRRADEPDGSALRDAVAQPQARAAALEGEAVARDVLEATVAIELQDMERGPMRQRA